MGKAAKCMGALKIGKYDADTFAKVYCTDYLKPYFACYPGDCCTKDIVKAFKTTMDSLAKTDAKFTCDASAVACGGTSSAFTFSTYNPVMLFALAIVKFAM